MPAGDDDTIASSLPTLSGGASEIAEVVADRYRIVRWLGGGGIGRVYEVEDLELGERVALKVLRAGLSDEAIARFRREVRLTRRIQHRNVARMFDIGEHQGDKFLTMELVDGAPLTRELGGALMIGVYRRWRDTGVFDAATWQRLIAAQRLRDRPHRIQIVTLQRMVEMAVLMNQHAPAIATLRASSDMGLIDIHWFDHCPLLGEIAAVPGFQELREIVAARAARVLAAFRAATS